jgi:hypothetical protein
MAGKSSLRKNIPNRWGSSTPPQRRFLLILNLGDGTGLLPWGPFSWHGRLAFWIKDRIDRAFLRAYHMP